MLSYKVKNKEAWNCIANAELRMMNDELSPVGGLLVVGCFALRAVVGFPALSDSGAYWLVARWDCGIAHSRVS